MDQSHLQSIHPEAKIAEKVEIGPFVTIARDVRIGEGTWIGPQVTIFDGVRIGANCRIFPGAVLGSIPQDLKFENEETLLEIGNNVTIREYCTLNRGTKANNKTTIGDNTLIMAYSHVAHDCIIGEHVVLANNATLAGHIEIGNHAIVGGMVAVHQFTNIGESAYIAGGSLVRKNVPPFVKVAREPLSYAGVNSVGLRRRGFSNKQINNIHEIYRILFVKGISVSKALQHIEATISATPERDKILGFIDGGEKGLVKGFNSIRK